MIFLFSWYKFCTSFIKSIPRHFIIFDAIILKRVYKYNW